MIFPHFHPENAESGGDSKEDPPVSMPNTEVKLLNVDDTWRATARESRKLPDFPLWFNQSGVYSFIAQLAERMTVNHDVAGSSPAGGAKKADTYAVYQLFVF